MNTFKTAVLLALLSGLLVAAGSFFDRIFCSLGYHRLQM